MNINFSKFHKVECDDNCTTLEHPNGHQIKIAHNKLAPELKKELASLPVKMAKGGYAKYAQKYDPNMPKKNSKPSQASKPLPQAAYTAPKESKMAFTEPDNMGTQRHAPQEQQYEAGDDVVLNAMNRKAPPYGALGAEFFLGILGSYF